MKFNHLNIPNYVILLN